MKFNEGGVMPTTGSLVAGDSGEVAAYSNRDFGLNLMFARKKAGMTQEKLADVTKIDKNSIARYETGYNCPGLDKAYTLARALGVSIDELAGLTQGVA